MDNFKLINTLELNNKFLSGINYYQYHFSQNMKGNFLTFRKDKKIIALNFKSRDLEFEIDLNKLGNIAYRDHLFLNEDSIFICSILNKNEMLILLIDKNGEIHQQWNINKLAEKNTAAYFYIDSGHDHPMTFINKKLYFQASYKFKPGTYIGPGVPIEMIMDLQSNSVNQIGELPVEYQQEIFYGNQQWEYSRVINNKGELVFSFPISHKLYVYDENGHLIKTSKCKSKYIDSFKPISKDMTTDLSTIIDAYNYNAQYSDLLYDKFNNQYFRIVLHNLDKFDTKGKIINFNNRRWSVIILDANLKIIKEVLMPDNKFWKRIVITDQGLMLKTLSNNNLDSFKLFKFQTCPY